MYLPSLVFFTFLFSTSFNTQNNEYYIDYKIICDNDTSYLKLHYQRELDYYRLIFNNESKIFYYLQHSAIYENSNTVKIDFNENCGMQINNYVFGNKINEIKFSKKKNIRKNKLKCTKYFHFSDSNGYVGRVTYFDKFPIELIAKKNGKVLKINGFVKKVKTKRLKTSGATSTNTL